MSDFTDLARRALRDNGYSMCAAARAINYDPAYLSRVLNGKQQPSPKFAEALDALVGAEGTLVGLLPGEPSLHTSVADEGIDGEIAHMRATVAYLLDHDNRYGADAVAPAAVQVWNAAQRKLDSGRVPAHALREYVSEVAELAQVAGWLLIVAGQRDASRAAFLEAHMLARHAGDRSKEWFALDMLALHGIQYGRPHEALRIADEIQSQRRVPPRVMLLARVRKARAFAATGCGESALSEVAAARGGLAESISPLDPAWAWWVDDCEISGHEGEVHLALGQPDKAVSKMHHALELATQQSASGRRELAYTIALLTAQAAGHAWRECEAALTAIPPLLESVSAGREYGRLRATLRDLSRSAQAPHWLTDLARDVASAPQLAITA
ncbi:helix-turn-helix domain-containing protein [Streptomyces cinnamoneus]|uniref:helix-turn-helix domain-containing protein n=1 Tax=Streptomyces cinnamoneus TaxID=53446 RepID=UPI0037AA6327